MKKLILASSFVFTGLSLAKAEVKCGGNFNEFKEGLKAEAKSMGISDTAIASVLNVASAPEQSILESDRGQGVFKMLFSDFASRVIRKDRLDKGALKLKELDEVFLRAEEKFGVPKEVIVAFWALETDFGGNQGSDSTAKALLTLAHDCRRPELFRPQVFGLMKLSQRGDVDPAKVTGAWAGEIGQVQMLPNDILAYGIDGDGDGHVSLKKSAADAIMSAANVLKSHGWIKNKPWVEEVVIDKSDIDNSEIWMHSGLKTGLSLNRWKQLGVSVRNSNFKYKASGKDLASLVAPEGKSGPKFFVYLNYTNVFLKWNQSFTYTLSASQLANQLAGGLDFIRAKNLEALSDDEVKSIQQKLSNLGYDVGKIDGIIGGGTRAAVRFEQMKLGLVADGWPTRELLNAL